jgi:hypothetical protein
VKKITFLLIITFISIVIIRAGILSLLVYEFTYTYQGKTLHYKRSSWNTVSVTYPSSKNSYISDNAIIPSKIKYKGITYSVTSIGDSAFIDCSNLKSITIPNSVTSIGESAFESCRSLINIEIPNSVTSINRFAFVCCDSLKSVKISNSVTFIGFSAFSGCSSLVTIEIPNSVTSIGDHAFSWCSSLTSIKLPNNITSIGWRVFERCRSLKNIKIPNNVTSIDNYAFSDCSSLENIVIPNNVDSIGRGAFIGCSSLTNVTISNNITYIGSAAFGDCINLIYNIYNDCNYLGNTSNPYIVFMGRKDNVLDVTINDSCKILYPECLEGSNITSITIPNNVISIGRNAFSNCNSLKSIEIPNNITSIDEGAFENCNNLNYNTYNSCNYLGNTSNPYIVFMGRQNNVLDIAINDSCKILYSECLKGSNIESITIPKSVISIGNYVLEGCNNLTKINVNRENTVYCNAIIETHTNTLLIGCKNTIIPNDVTSIGENAFANCKSLINIKIPKSVTSINDYAFSGCSGLKSIKIPKGVTSIGESAFEGCSSLKSIKIPRSVTSIGMFAFSGCVSLTNITILNDTISTEINNAFDKTTFKFY